jgi:hypothetical protein
VRRTVQARDDFVMIPFPRLASTSDRLIAAAVEGYKREAAVVDARLAREVTVAQKATALSDLCDQLRKSSGVRLEAGRSVADEKVTVFCEKMPLRDVMRQLGRPFGYTWLRSGKEGEYRYELVQDLRSQLVEEELRNRDRNAALLAMDREVERYRPYLNLSPEEALAKAKTAAPGEKWLLEKFAGDGWGPIQAYFRLSRDELAALRAGQTLKFSQDPKPGEQPLPAAFARDVLQSFQRARGMRIVISGENIRTSTDPNDTAGRPVTEVPQARAVVSLSLDQSDLGQFVLHGNEGFTISIGGNNSSWENGGNITGSVLAPGVRNPQNATANAHLAHDPALRKTVTVRGVKRQASGVREDARRQASGVSPATAPTTVRPTDASRLTPDVSPDASRLTPDASQEVTSADVLEALHKASGAPIAADFYTRLYPAAAVAVQEQPLFDALNRIADTMRLRWTKDGEWLQFRSTSYYDDRLKEVPNRLLARWAASRKEHGVSTLEDLTEIGQLSEAQLNARDMAKGARVLWGLEEWDLARNRKLQTHLNYLATLTPSQRQAAQSSMGLAFAQMTLAQQQQYIALATGSHPDQIQSLDELAGATLRVEYTLPGGFEWRVPGKSSGAVSFSPARGPTREAALQAALRVSARAEAAQIVPTELAVSFRFAMRSPQTGSHTHFLRVTPGGTWSSTDRSTPDGKVSGAGAAPEAKRPGAP